MFHLFKYWRIKIAAKRAFEKLIQDEIINPDEVEGLYFYVDEHTTATNGRYELQEALEQEFKLGTFNYKNGTKFAAPNGTAY